MKCFIWVGLFFLCKKNKLVWVKNETAFHGSMLQTHRWVSWSSATSWSRDSLKTSSSSILLSQKWPKKQHLICHFPCLYCWVVTALGEATGQRDWGWALTREHRERHIFFQDANNAISSQRQNPKSPRYRILLVCTFEVFFTIYLTINT